jgi:hypothetical protein
MEAASHGANGAAPDVVGCAFSAGRAADEMMDAAVYIWASTKRCSAPIETGHCVIDVASAAESFTATIGVIVRALRDCGELQANMCGVAAGHLVQSLAGLTAASTGVLEQCVVGENSTNSSFNNGGAGECLIDAKDSMRSLYRVIDSSMSASKVCKGDAQGPCAGRVLQILSAFSAMGQYIAGIVSHCVPVAADQGQQYWLGCGEEIGHLTHHSTALASAAARMSASCSEQHTQLYADYRKQADAAQKINTAIIALVAMLPVTAVMAYFVGKRSATEVDDRRSLDMNRLSSRLSSRGEDARILSRADDTSSFQRPASSFVAVASSPSRGHALGMQE